MKKFKCIKTFVVDKYDADCSLIEDGEFIVEEGSEWTQDPDSILYLVGDSGMKLCDEDGQWLEIHQERLKEYFEPVGEGA